MSTYENVLARRGNRVGRIAAIRAVDDDAPDAEAQAPAGRLAAEWEFNIYARSLRPEPRDFAEGRDATAERRSPGLESE